MRVGERNAKGRGVKPMLPKANSTICACGECGLEVKTPGRKYRPGHYAKTAAAKNDHRQARFCGEVRLCPVCPTRFRLKPSAVGGRRTCSAVCKSIYTYQERAWAGCSLQQRCLVWMREKRATLAALARTVGVDERTLSRWFETPGRALSMPGVKALAGLFGISESDAIDELGTGGLSGNDRKKLNMAIAAAHLPQPGTEARRLLAQQAGDANARYWKEDLGDPGPIVSLEVLAEREQRRSATDGAIQRIAAFTARAKTPEGRVVSRLMGLLAHSSQPDRNTINTWARETVDELAGDIPWLDVGWVRRRWRKYLVRRQLLPKGGRPSDRDACTFVREQLAALETSGDRLPYGFWGDVEREANRRGLVGHDGEPRSGQGWKIFWRNHECPQCSGERRGRRQTV